MSNKIREIALEILNEVYEDKSLEICIEKNNKFQVLDKRDRSFIKMLLLTFLRRNGEVDSVIEGFLSKPINKKLIFVKNILRLGVTQILYMNVPDYSSVNTSVNIIKKKNPLYSKLVNALLRRVCRAKKEDLINSNPILNIPKWLIKGWIKSYGMTTSKKIAHSLTSQPMIDINIKKDQFMQKNWEKIFKGRNIFKNIIRIEKAGDITKLPFFDEGFWWVQSVSASIPVEIINDFYEKKVIKEKKVLEIGSAPGGKTIQLLDNDFNVTGLEISKKRIKILQKNLSRLNLQTRIINNDILKWKNKEFFDCVLLDSPCSATGLIKKKPEILINKTKANIKNLIKKQKSIAQKVSEIISINGLLIYVVCSIEFEEGQNQITNFLKKNKNYKIIKINEKIFDGLEFINNNGMISITPNCNASLGGMDGFFIACLQRTY